MKSFLRKGESVGVYLVEKEEGRTNEEGEKRQDIEALIL